MNIRVPIMWGIKCELEKLDFSFLDISLLNTKSEAFKQYFKTIEKENFSDEVFVEVMKDIHTDVYDTSELYAIVKNDPYTDYRYSNVHNLYMILVEIHLLLLLDGY